MVIGSVTLLYEVIYKSDGDVDIEKLELSGVMALGLPSSISETKSYFILNKKSPQSALNFRGLFFFESFYII